MSLRIEDPDEFIRGQIEYWRQVEESEGFDIDHISVPQGTNRLLSYDCSRMEIKHPKYFLVERYARLGLHLYNETQGTNFQYSSLQKFNQTMLCLVFYYITLVVRDPITTALSTFQVGVHEQSYDTLNLNVFIARPTGTPKTREQLEDFGPGDTQLPYWPSDFSDTKRFYKVNESELQYYDWIRLYLELALCTNDRGIEESTISDLQIVKVSIENLEDVDITIFYITFKGLANARVGEIGEHVDRNLIIRRDINQDRGEMTLVGGFGFPIGQVAEKRGPMTHRPFKPTPISRLRPLTLHKLFNRCPKYMKGKDPL